MERVQQRAIEREDEMQGYNVWQADQRLRAGGRQGPGRRRRGAGPRGQQRRKPTTLIDDWADLEWKKRWQREARDREATTWRTPWEQSPLKLYSDLPKHQATALFLLRTEVIGLNAWLASIRVPNVTPQCECGWQAQTVRHVLLHCPKYRNERPGLLGQTGSEDLKEMLSRPKSARAAARWLVKQGVLRQFDTANQIEEEDTTDHNPFQPLEEIQ